MSFRIQQHVVRLEITMDDALRVDIPQGTSQLCHPKPHCLLGETLPRNMKPKIAAIHQIHHDVAKIGGVSSHTLAENG
jgi:hypothetical protein